MSAQPARPLTFFAQPIMLRSKSDQNLLTREWEPFALGNGGWLQVAVGRGPPLGRRAWGPAFRCRCYPGRLYNTLAKSGHRAPHGSFILCESFFGQSAVISVSQSITFASRPRLLIR